MFRHKRKTTHSEKNFFLGDLETVSKPSSEEKQEIEKEEVVLQKHPSSEKFKNNSGIKKPRRALRQIPAEQKKDVNREEHIASLPVSAVEKEENKTPSFPPSAEKANSEDFSKKSKKTSIRFLENKKRLPKKASRDLKKNKNAESTSLAQIPDAGADIKASLEGMYGVYSDPEKNKKKTLGVFDYVRYGILFVCIFGFLTASFFVFRKLYDYYRAYVVYSGLQEMVSEKDRFAEEYLKKATSSVQTLTPEDILSGKTTSDTQGNAAFTSEQETLVSKIAQLKKINPDTAGWIKIEGTVVNYPIVWSPKRNYYLHRDFYGKSLSGGAIFMDERNFSEIIKNRNTVIYGHNMSDGSMFASIHDFASASIFYSATIEIATSDGIYVFEPFSVHESNAFDNYFETNFGSDQDFVNFCEQMAFISLYETEHKFDKNSQIITLSTCDNNEHATDRRFAVHAVLTKVIR